MLNPADNDPADTDQLYGVVPPLAASAAEYALFTCPPGKDDVVIWTGLTAAVTLKLNALVEVCGVCSGSLA